MKQNRFLPCRLLMMKSPPDRRRRRAKILSCFGIYQGRPRRDNSDGERAAQVRRLLDLEPVNPLFFPIIAVILRVISVYA